jgi:DNA-binding MarR family transcriptional regulator
MTTIIAHNKDTLLEEAFLLFGQIIARADPSRLDEWASLGLTITQLRVLFILRSEPGLPARSLAERLDVTPSTLTRIMDRLDRNRLIKRRTDDQDRRCVNHYLSARGSRLVEEMEAGARSRTERVFRQLDRDGLERVVAALRDLTQAMDIVAAVERAEVSG